MPAYYDNVTALNPKVWFKLNETTGTPANSGSLGAVALTKNGSGTIDLNQTGVIDKAVRFNNTTAASPNYTYYDVASASSNTCMDDRIFSIEFWIKWNDTGGNQNQGIIYDLRDGNNYLTVQYSPFGIGPIVGFRGGTSYPEYNLYGSVANNNSIYRHVVLTFTPTAVKLYNDGTLISTVNNPNIPNSFVWDTISAKKLGAQGGMLIDEFIIYDQELTAAQVLSNYNAPYSTVNNATVVTASALLPMPAVSAVRNPNYTASAMTASGLLPNPSWNFTNYPTMLDTYLAARSFEQWYKFDEIGKINNYGSGGDNSTAWAFNGETVNIPQGGIQGSGALKLKGEQNNTVQIAFGVTESYTPEITDNEFSIGFWFKGESGVGAQEFNILNFQEIFSSNNYLINVTSQGYIRFIMNHNNTAHIATSLSNNNTNWCDGNWHFIQVRRSESAKTLKLTIDNGTEVSTTTGNHSPSVSTMQFGLVNNSGTNNKYAYISNMFITGYNSITSTERSAMITAAAVPIQGTAKIIPATARFTNQYQEKIDTYSPKIAFRLNEASGTPINYGTSNGTFSVGKNGTNITYLQPTQNTYAYKFTNGDTCIQGDYSYTSGTFSTGNVQTMAAVFKAESTVNFEQIIGSMGMYGFIGSGITLSIGATNGYLGARINQGFGPTDQDTLTTTINVCDNKYHHVVGIRNGTSFKLYLDGKQVATSSIAVTNLSDTGAYGISAESKYNSQGSAAKALHIDEFAVMSTALNATQVFELYQLLNVDGAFIASGLMVQPTNSAGTGRTINPGVSTATALLVDPSQLDTIAPTIAPMTLDAMFQMPNFAATKNTNNASAPMTASATGENPVVTAGANKGALHMTAIASFPEAKARIPGVWNADPFTTSAEMVQPGLATTKGALIKPQSLNASAQLPLPPAYFTITDDRWYQRLQLVDYDSNTANGNIAFFNTSTDIYRGGGFSGWNAPSNTNVFNSYYGYNLTDSPLPVAYAGTYDPQNRKALRLRNIALAVTDGFYNTGTNWTFETYIKTTKKNQVLFVGKQLGDPSNSQSQNFNTAWRLKDGKIALNQEKSTRLGFPNSNDDIAFTGFKDIADGEWHHIIVQFRQTGEDKNFPRTQVFIDGEIDIQRYGNRAYTINQVGFNSPDVNAYSDFETSAVALNQGSFVLERETRLNYYAATGIIPVEAAVATASATATPGNKGRGNRGRALMLYFWPTFKLDDPRYLPYQRFMGGQLGLGFTNFDQGTYGGDPDTFYAIPTQLGNSANQFYDWDIWPVPVTNYPGGDTYIGDTHPILNDGIFGQTDKGLSYINPITANERYLNLQEDLKDLSQFDMICFRNYPDDSSERDAYGTTAKGVADTYFNVLDKTLFEEFLVSLRDAVDSGISLLVTNPQLAVDMGFIDTYHAIDALDGAGKELGDYTPVKLKDPLATGTPVLDFNYPTVYTNPTRTNAYEDYYRNNYHQVVNTLPGLTDDPAYIWKDEAYYKVDGLEYGELDRVWSHIEYNSGLQPGDKFLISSMINAYGYYAVPIDSVKAGKVITKFADTYMHGTTERVNPYRNYATSIAIEPGTVVAGKQIGAKVFISFTDNVGQQKSLTSSYLNPGSNTPIETRIVELKSDYWIDYAYSTGSISESERDQYKADPKNIDRLYPTGGTVYNALKYWTLNGQDVIGQAEAFDGTVVGTDTAESVKSGKKVAKTRAGMRRKNTVSTSSLPAYTIQSSWTFPTLSVPVPNINTRGLWWLSERLAYETLPQRPLALEADAFMPQPVVTGYKVASVNAQSALASATIVETNLRSGTISRNNAPLPMMATAALVPLGLNINPGVAIASARLTTNFSTITSKDDDVVLYIMHEDPILYIREDAIK
jgi:hypothetical protein